MLRTVFVASIIAVGFLYALYGPFYSLLFYLWLAYFRPESWMWVDWVTPMRLSFIVGVVLVISTILAPPPRRENASSQWWTFGLAFAISVWSAINSLAPDWSWMWWFEFAKALLVAFLITTHVNDSKRLRVVLLVIALSLGLETAKQGWAQFVRNPGASNANPHPMLGDNNGVALGMFMLAPVFSALAATARSKREKYVHNFFWVGIILRGISTYSRGGFLAAGALAVVYLLRSPRRLRAIWGIVVVAALLYPVMPDQFWDRMNTIDAAEGERDASAAGRLYMWDVARSMAADHPFTGVGFNAYSRVYDRYDVSHGAYGRRRAVHSAWFGALAEMGYPGLILLLSAVGLSFWNTHRVIGAAKRREELAPLLPYALALQASFLVYVVGGSFINAQYSEMLWHFVALSIALRNVAFAPLRTTDIPAPVAADEVHHGSTMRYA